MDSNPPASETDAANDLPPAHVADVADDLAMTPAQHHQMGHAYIGAAHDAIDKAAGHFTAHNATNETPAEASQDAPGTPETDGSDADRSFPGSGQRRAGNFHPESGAARSQAALRRRS